MTTLAMLFPGQGSQSVGMLAELAAERREVRDTFEEAGQALETDLWKLISEGPGEDLDRTELTQPAMLAGGIAIWRVWQALGGPMPVALAGHSLGEYSALVAAQALDFSDAIKVVSRRGQLMQSAVPAGVGAMAAILGLEDEVVEAICRESCEDQVVAPANYNSPGQLVIAGHSAAVERAMHKCRDAGAKRAMTLPVSVPSHSRLMEPAAAGLAEVLAAVEIAAPRVPVLHNIDCQPRKTPEEIRKALIGQLSAPVRWTGTIQAMSSAGIRHLAECGPGRVLAGLARRIDRKLPCASLLQVSQFESLIAELES
jgi:[acyl-carrier-protein] S-malonyltransferase